MRTRNFLQCRTYFEACKTTTYYLIGIVLSRLLRQLKEHLNYLEFSQNHNNDIFLYNSSLLRDKSLSFDLIKLTLTLTKSFLIHV